MATPVNRLDTPLSEMFLVQKKSFGKVSLPVLMRICSFLTTNEYLTSKPTCRLFREIQYLGKVEARATLFDRRDPRSGITILNIVQLFSRTLERGSLSRVRTMQLDFVDRGFDRFIPESRSALAKLGLHCPTLTHLSLTKTPYEGFRCLMSHCSTVTRLDLCGFGKWENIDEVLKMVPQLQELWIHPDGDSSTHIPLGLLPRYAKIPQLRSIYFSNVNPLGVKAFWNHQALEFLNVDGSLPDKRAQNLTQIPHIRALTLVNCEDLTNLGFLQEMKELRSLTFDSYYGLKRELFSTLKAPPTLEELVVDNSLKLQDEHLQVISSCKGLRTLKIREAFADITHQGLARLAACPKLEYLELGIELTQKKLCTTGDVVDLVSRLPNLRDLRLTGRPNPMIDKSTIKKTLAQTRPALDVRIKDGMFD